MRACVCLANRSRSKEVLFAARPRDLHAWCNSPPRACRKDLQRVHDNNNTRPRLLDYDFSV